MTGKPAAAILKAPGTNCDVETSRACELAGFTTRTLLIRECLHQEGFLQGVRLFVIPGGFSYGDDLGAGTILGSQLSRLREPLLRHLRRGGLILAICNGFQVLTRSGFLPFPEEGGQVVTLARNVSGRFEDRWVHLRVTSRLCPMLDGIDQIEVPVNHGEGRFLPRSAEVMERLKKSGQIVLRYVDPAGGEASYPWNPNGSVEGVAGICDPTGRVLGLMPHPEKHVEPWQHPDWTRGIGSRGTALRIFENAARTAVSCG